MTITLEKGVASPSAQSSQTLVGQIEAFHPEEDEWSIYLEQVEQYFDTNGITNNRKRAIFLSVCGKTTYRVIRNLVNPDKPADKSFKEIRDTLNDHYDRKLCEIVQSFQFHSRHHLPSETVEDYVENSED